MRSKSDHNTNASFSHHGVFRLLIPNKEKTYFEKVWLPHAYEVQLTFQGFKGRHVHHLSARDGFSEFVIVVVFESLEYFRNYLTSTERLNLMNDLINRGIVVSVLNEYGGVLEGDINGISHHDGATVNPLLGDVDSALNKMETGLNKSDKFKNNRISIGHSLPQIPKAMPPPKWKLTLVLIHAVFISVMVSNFSGSQIVMAEAGMPKGLYMFITIMHLIIMLQYAGLPLVMSIKPLDRWIKAPRMSPEDMFPLHCILDQGLGLFIAKNNAPAIPKEVLRRIEVLESRVDTLRHINYKLKEELGHAKQLPHNLTDIHATTPTEPEHTFSMHHSQSFPVLHDKDSNSSFLPSSQSYHNNSNLVDPVSQVVSKYYPLYMAHKDETHQNNPHRKLSIDDINIPRLQSVESEADNHVSLAVRHYVKWECALEFEKWTDEMDEEMARYHPSTSTLHARANVNIYVHVCRYPGYLGMVRIAPVVSSLPKAKPN
jgi:antibiotic biosynthesis monooxygenase (ABM) superfamily enzyme